MRFCRIVQKPTPTVTSAAVESAVSQCLRMGRQTARTSMNGSRSALVGAAWGVVELLTIGESLGYRGAAGEKSPGIAEVRAPRGAFTGKH
jgi:hypothetical protein